MSSDLTAATMPEKARRNFLPWIQVLREKLEAVNKDVESIKKLAFDIPQGLNRNLVFFWVAHVLSVLGRFIMFNVVELKA